MLFLRGPSDGTDSMQMRKPTRHWRLYVPNGKTRKKLFRAEHLSYLPNLTATKNWRL